MEMELSQKTIDAIAYKVAVILSRKQKESKEEIPEMVTCTEAARILRIKPKRLRELKDYFPHVKSGAGPQGRLLFKRSALLESYNNIG